MNQDIVDLENPVLRAESGAILARFSSATIVQYGEGGCDLHTEPQALPDNFPFSAYAHPDAASLYIESRQGTFKVRIRERMLELA